MTTTQTTKRTTAWRWIVLAVVGALVAAAAVVVVLVQPQRALSDGATNANAAVADAFPLDIGTGVLQGDTTGMSGVQGDGATVGQVLWYRWRTNAADAASLPGTAYLLYDSGTGVPATVQLRVGPETATQADLSAPLAPTASTPATGAYEFDLAELAPGEYFYIGVETGSPGAFLMSIWQPTPGGPPNDDLVNAESLDLVVNGNLDGVDVALASGTAALSTLEADEPPAGSATGSVWYSWVVPQDDGRLDVTVGSGAVDLEAFQRLDPAAADSEGVVVDSSLDELPPDAGGWTPPDSEAVGQFDPSVFAPRDDLVAGGVAGLTGNAGEVLLLRVVGDGPFTLLGDISGILPPDLAAPTWSCASDVATGSTDWARTWAGATETPVVIDCTVEDPGGLLDPETEWFEVVTATTATVTLTVSAPAGTASASVYPEARLVCDLADNCVQVGVGTSVQIDNAPPVLGCDAVPTGWLYGVDATPPDGTVTSTIACAASDAASGLAEAADAAFQRVATLDATTPAEDPAVAYTGHPDICDAVGNCISVPAVAAAKLDRKAPVVDCQGYVVPPSGWFRDDVHVDCAIADAGSGLANAAQATTTITTSVPPGTVDPAAASAVTRVCDAVGNCATLPQLTGIRIDRAAPLVACDPLPAWTAGTSLSLRCTATDQAGASGLADPGADAAFAVELTIPAGTQSTGLRPEPRSVCDAAGNCAGLPAFAGVGLDDLAPTVTCAAAPTGWLRADMTVACTASDGGSGLVDPADAAFVLATAFTGTASETVAFVAPKPEICDAVGNCTSVPLPTPVRIDRVDPRVSCVGPVDGAYDFNVTIACTASDDHSGLATGATLDFVLRTAVVPGTAATGVATNSREVCDLAGNCVVFGPYGAYDIDLTAAPASPAPVIDAPGAVDVIAAAPAAGFTGTRAPFASPTVTSEIGAVLDCAPDGTGIYRLGTTDVTCTARDAADRVVTSSFPVRVTLAPELAASDPIPLDRPIPVAGAGFAGPVSVEVGGVVATTLTPSGGTVSGGVPVPAGIGTGSQTVVLRGTGSGGDPLLVVKPVTIAAAVGPEGEPGGGSGGPGGSGDGESGGTGGADGTGGAGSAGGASAVSDGTPSPAARAQDAERGFVLDPERWPSERFEDGGGVHEDDGTAAPAPEAAGLPPLAWVAIALGGALVLGGAAAGGLMLARRRGA